MTSDGRRSLVFAALALAGVTLFVLVTSAGLPDPVAAHFDAAGVPNGFMPRSVYVALTLVLAIGVPLLLLLPIHWASAGSGARLNLPHKDYWLHPERRAQTIAYLKGKALMFSCAIGLFVCYVHWLVVAANRRQPPQLSSSALLAALAVLLGLLAIWLATLLAHFKKP